MMSEIMENKGEKLTLNLNHLTHELNSNTETANYNIDISSNAPYATYSPKISKPLPYKGFENPAYIPEGEGYVCKRNVTNTNSKEFLTIYLCYF